MKVFDSVPVKIPAKNVFNLSHDVKSSYNFDKLYPFLCQPIYPGDTFNCRAEVFMRAMPLLCPVMHNVDMNLWFFFVPHRLSWWDKPKKTDFRTFITGGEDGKQRPTVPYFTYSQLQSLNSVFIQHGSLIDHLGFPTISNGAATLKSGTTKVCSLPLRAYQLIYNEYFRNQNVQNEVEFSQGPGQETDADLTKLATWRYKCWEKDYFTSCLPFLQRGQEMTLPITGEQSATGILPVVVNTARPLGDDTAFGLKMSENPDNLIYVDGAIATSPKAVDLEGTASVTSGSLTFTGLSIGTINDFRYCLRLQQWMENNARCGSRYIEQLFAHFGVRSSDARLQRPELLGGGKIPLIFTDVPQTSFGEGENDNVLGDLSGKGTLYGKTGGFKKYFEEHGVLIGILSIVPRTSYYQGIPRAWSLFDKENWYFPEFAHLGEQAVTLKEVYYDPTVDYDVDYGPDDPFGYQGRFTELRYIPSSVHGDMRGSLSYWHFARKFDTAPVLNSDFVTAQSAVDSFAMSDVRNNAEDPFVCQIHLDIKATRPMPKYAVPTL